MCGEYSICVDLGLCNNASAGRMAQAEDALMSLLCKAPRWGSLVEHPCLTNG